MRGKRSVGSSVLIERVCVKDERRVAAFGWVKATHFSTANRIAHPLRTSPLGVLKREQHSATLDQSIRPCNVGLLCIDMQRCVTWLPLDY